MFRGCHSFPSRVLVSIEFHLASLVILTLHVHSLHLHSDQLVTLGTTTEHPTEHVLVRITFGRNMALTPDSSRRTCVS